MTFTVTANVLVSLYVIFIIFVTFTVTFCVFVTFTVTANIPVSLYSVCDIHYLSDIHCDI